MDEKIPTEEEIAKLPRWAQVAFAARCARRVLPLLKRDWPDSNKQSWKTRDHRDQVILNGAVVIAENAARAARAADAWAARAADAAGPPDTADGSGALAARAALAAVLAASSGAEHVAAAAVFNAALNASVACTTPRLIDYDFEALVAATVAGNWTDDTPVPPTVFGSMWPDGPPPGWPLDPDADVLRLRIEIPDDATDDDIKRMVRELVGAMNDAHRANGGSGLQVDNLRLFDTSGVPAGVPQ